MQHFLYEIFFMKFWNGRYYEADENGLDREDGIGVYRFSTNFSFCLKMFLSSPRVDSIFSRENWFSPSADLSLATHELSSVTVLSRRTHSLTRTSHFLTQVSEIALTASNLVLRAATSASASACVVILLAAA